SYVGGRACRAWPPGPAFALLPADVVAGLELPPEGDLRLARGDLLHQRGDVLRLRRVELLETLRVRPLVDHHDLAFGAVEAVRDHSARLRSLGDAADHVPALGRELLELGRVPRKTQRHED